MARVWQRLGAVVFFGFVLLCLSNCKGKQKAGDKCTHNNMYICDDATNGLLCQDGTVVAVACRGPGGCKGTGAQSECDDDIGKENENCIMATGGGTNRACTVDKKGMLECVSGKWKLVSGCKGPKACSVTGTTLHCDDDFADIGDPCVTEANDANYSCTPDKQSEVVCQNNKFVVWRPCKGPTGCSIQNSKVNCDWTFSSEGDTCRTVDTYACTTDATQMLKCSPQFKWTKDKDCKKEGCKVKGNQISCK
jgi:hypothetical protein